MNIAVFKKAIKNVRQHRDIKLITAKAIRNHLVSELNYHTIKIFSDELLAKDIYVDIAKDSDKMTK